MKVLWFTVEVLLAGVLLKVATLLVFGDDVHVFTTGVCFALARRHIEERCFPGNAKP